VAGVFPNPDGRPPWQPTAEEREKVKALAGRGVPEVNIAALVGVSKHTLRKHCKDDIEAGRSVAVSNVLGAVYKAALAGEFKQQQLYLANTIGWTSSHKVELSGSLKVSDRLERAIARKRGEAPPQSEESGDDAAG
jgi:hypothetical protein